MIQDLTNDARLYAQARANARVQRRAKDAHSCDYWHDRAHALALEADGITARQITALAVVFAKNRDLACPLSAVCEAELIPQDAA